MAQLSEAKNTFKSLIIEHKGDANHVDVKEALNNLVQLATKARGRGGDTDTNTAVDEWFPTHNAPMNQGRWRTITPPPFGGKLPAEPDGKSRFTLGRMSFGMFKPIKLVCAVEDIVNIVIPIKDEEGGDDEVKEGGDDTPQWTQSYIFECLIDIEVASTRMPAKIVTNGMCFPVSPTRLGIKFTGGTLQPRFEMSSSENASLAALWERTFDKAVAKEADSQSYLGSIGTWMTNKVMNLMMGLEPPVEVDASDFTQTYTIGKPLIAHLDIIYLDEDFRVTKGSRGTIVVVERLAAEED